MITQELIELRLLREYFVAILPQLATFRLKADPEGFLSKFALLERRLQRGSE